ncbi:MAG: DUF924 domain-containing protein [Alphaproteobacteria bacterium]|nr:DUF924 domain-containing protein [Alphaproteobacteria bacterium]
MADFRGIFDFWFSDQARPRWFVKEAAFDEAIRLRFESTLRAAAAGDLRDWQETAEGALALVILLDQFPRNIYRGTARAFATDGQALGVADLAIQRGFDLMVPADRRIFFYLPFEHSENLADQDRAIDLIRERIGDARTIEFALKHKVIIARFGRFPHRNAALGRPTTPDEADFLKGADSSF